MIVFACRGGRPSVLRRLCLASVIGCAVAATAWAEVPDEIRDYALPAAGLAQSINAIGQSNDVQVIYEAALLQGKTAGPIAGPLTMGQALDKALAGSGLTYEFVNSGRTVVIREAPVAPRGDRPAAPVDKQEAGAEAAVEPTTLSAVTVTGTRIRGGVTASPTITIGAQQIQDEGFTDLGEVIRSIPQNFSGGQNPGVVNGTASSNTNQNITGGSALNLRGLGGDASLTLLNGRRLAYDGFAQAVDLSAIPVEAVERLEIIPDGASAIYGSDAVGGVANVILKRDYEGVTVSTAHGVATDGGLTSHEYTATGGAAWSTGGLIATVKKASNDPVYSDQRDYTKGMFTPTTIYPGGELRSGLLSMHQQLGDIVEFHLDTLRTQRENSMQISYGSLYYDHVPDGTITLVSPSVEVLLPNDWTLSIGGAWGKDLSTYYQAPIDAATGVASAVYRGAYDNKSHSYDVGIEGPMFALAGGDARLALGAGYRTNSFQYQDSGTIYANGEEGSRFAYAEANFPLIGEDQGIAGMRRLEVTAAIRSEDYDSFGKVTTPKLGILYGPSADFTLKASWGKSFKAPTLLQLYQTQPVYLYAANVAGGVDYPADATVLWHGAGGNPDLEPERARTWSASLAFHPESLPGLQAEMTWFDIDYTDRVMLPITVLGQALSNPQFSSYITYSPSAAQQEAILATASRFYNYAANPYDPSDVVAIITNLYTNVARQRIKGLDLSSSYRADFGPGRLTLLGSASWLDSSRQVTAAQSAYNLSGNLFNPARIKARAGAVWSQGKFTGSTFGNYTDGVTNASNGKKAGSFTTFDVVLRYAIGKRSDGLSGLTFGLSAHNVFDRPPPLYAIASGSEVPYDSTNYSAIGRLINVSVSKHW